MNQNNTNPKTNPDKDQKGQPGQPGQGQVRPDPDQDQTRQGGHKDKDDAPRR